MFGTWLTSGVSMQFHADFLSRVRRDGCLGRFIHATAVQLVDQHDPESAVREHAFIGAGALSYRERSRSIAPAEGKRVFWVGSSNCQNSLPAPVPYTRNMGVKRRTGTTTQTVPGKFRGGRESDAHGSLAPDFAPQCTSTEVHEYAVRLFLHGGSGSSSRRRGERSRDQQAAEEVRWKRLAGETACPTNGTCYRSRVGGVEPQRPVLTARAGGLR